MTDKPERPMSAYILWLNRARESIKAEHPGLKVTEIAKKGGEIWRGMKDKSVWEEKAAKAKEQYTKDLESYNANGGGGEGGGKKATKREKKIEMAKPMVILLALMLIGVVIYLKCSCNSPHPPNLDPEEWWGPKELRARQDKTIKPFQVKFGEEMIKDLKDRLKRHRPFVLPLEDSGFRYGFNSAQLDTWINYWAQKYPFEEREKFLNKFPQYKTNVQGLDMHFIRVKPQVQSGVEVVPLLLMHGWPGSVREFYEAIPLLTTKTSGHAFVFEVIVPSLPGYGFSDAAVRPGLGAAHVAVVMRNLMNRLGFKKYYVQGGDWGAAIASAISTLFPDEVLGHHTNMAYVPSTCNMMKTVLGSVFPSLVVEPHLADRMYPLSDYFAYFLEEFGYMHLQSTKPDTVGVALTDSPSGLLAYILEKFSTWTIRENRNLPDGGLVSKVKFTKDQLIDNLMVYWSTNSITTSMRLYSESMNKKYQELNLDCIQSNVPTWALQAKEELFYQPPGFLKSKYPNLLNTTVLDFGGHFFAFEEPKVFAEDVFKAVDAFKSWHKQRVKTEL